MFNDALRLIRVYHDLNQTEAARRVGLSKSYISALEAGNKKITIEVLEKYSEAFQIPISSLMLFAERNDSHDYRDNARHYIAGKVVKMLDWLSSISDDKKMKQERNRG